MYKRTNPRQKYLWRIEYHIQNPKEDKQKNFATRTHWHSMWILALVTQTRTQTIGQNLHGK